MASPKDADTDYPIFVEILSIVLLLVLAKVAAKELFHDIDFAYRWLLHGYVEHEVARNLTSSSVLDHFRTAFFDPELLIKGMAKNNFILSGSRALDYFVPGSASPESDWDFYIPNNEACIAGALSVLEKGGVIWDDMLTPLRKLAETDDEKTIHLTRKMAEAYTEFWNSPFTKQKTAILNADFKQLMQDLTCAVANVDKEQTSTILVNNTTIHIHAESNHTAMYNSTFSNSVNSAFHPYGPGLNVVRGTIPSATSPDGTTHTVQLISSHDNSKTPLDLILAFYASHVQCFISAFGAAHLYFPSGKNATTWPLNTQHRPSADAALEKYTARGYTFTSRSISSKHGQRRLRQLADSRSSAKLVEFAFPFAFDDVPTPLQALRRTALKKIMWIETPERTFRVADAQVEEAMRAWVKARNAGVLKGVIVEDEMGEEARRLVWRIVGVGARVGKADGKGVRDTILGF